MINALIIIKYITNYQGDNHAIMVGGDTLKINSIWSSRSGPSFLMDSGKKR
jgi:hypothetical protein